MSGIEINQISDELSAVTGEDYIEVEEKQLDGSYITKKFKLGTMSNQAKNDVDITGGSISGTNITEKFVSVTDPALNGITQEQVDDNNGVLITLTAAGNAQTLPDPTLATVKKVTVINNDTSTNTITVEGITLNPGTGQTFIWDGTAWGPTTLGITEIPVPQSQGGTGSSTGNVVFTSYNGLGLTEGTDGFLIAGGTENEKSLTVDESKALSDKADKDTEAVTGNLAQFDVEGNPVDSGVPSESTLALLDDVYGLQWDRSTNTFTRLYSAKNLTGGSDFDSCEPWASIQRCNVADDGTINAYYGDIGFAYDGTNGEVMTEVPKFYYRMWRTATGAIMLVSPTQHSGFKLYPAFMRNGNEIDYIYPSSFEGYYDSVTGMMRSIANVVPSTSDGVSDGGLSPITAYPDTTVGVEGIDTNGGDIRNCQYWAQARGANWEQYDFLTHNALCMLAFVEYGTFDLQTAIGLGVVNKAGGTNNNAELTGQTAGYAGGTDLGNTSGQISTNGLKSMSYRGIENLYGNIWKWVVGLNIKADNDPYISDHGFESDKFTDPYYALGVTLPSANGYGGDFVLNDIIDFGFLTSALGGASNSGLFDYYSQNIGNRVARIGNGWIGGLNAGPLYWALSNDSAAATRVVGGRSLHLPAPYVRS